MHRELDVPVPPAAPVDLVAAPDSPNGDASLATLVRQLADDGRLLLQQEIALAKAEVQTNVVGFAKRTALIGAGAALLLVGLLVLTAFLVIALGDLLGGRHWLSALIVGGVLAAAGGTSILVGRSGLAKHNLRPDATVASLRESADWARTEAQQLKHDLTRSNGQA